MYLPGDITAASGKVLMADRSKICHENSLTYIGVLSTCLVHVVS
jgi:hypothetical protein